MLASLLVLVTLRAYEDGLPVGFGGIRGRCVGFLRGGRCQLGHFFARLGVVYAEDTVGEDTGLGSRERALHEVSGDPRSKHCHMGPCASRHMSRKWIVQRGREEEHQAASSLATVAATRPQPGQPRAHAPATFLQSLDKHTVLFLDSSPRLAEPSPRHQATYSPPPEQRYLDHQPRVVDVFCGVLLPYPERWRLRVVAW